MKLEHFAKLAGSSDEDIPDIDFKTITEDSREVVPGSLFVAARGERADGHDFIDDAKSRGAVAVAGEGRESGQSAGLPYVTIPHARRGLGFATAWISR